jgi:hypothetical protein
VGSMRRRLEALQEAYADTPRQDDVKESIRREALVRMSLPEKRAYVAALRRARESGGVFAEEDRPILERVAALREEVRDGLEASAKPT